MPLVTIIRDDKVVDDEMMEVIVAAMPKLVSSALNVPDSPGELTLTDIEVRVEKFGPLDNYGKYDIAVIVQANFYPEREANRDERTRMIAIGLRALINPGLTRKKIEGFVWLFLQPASFVEFIASDEEDNEAL